MMPALPENDVPGVREDAQPDAPQDPSTQQHAAGQSAHAPTELAAARCSLLSDATLRTILRNQARMLARLIFPESSLMKSRPPFPDQSELRPAEPPAEQRTDEDRGAGAL